MKRHVPAQALLVGHALDNDLAALKLHHRRLLDTSVMFEHPRVSCAVTWQSASSRSHYLAITLDRRHAAP